MNLFLLAPNFLSDFEKSLYSKTSVSDHFYCKITSSTDRFLKARFFSPIRAMCKLLYCKTNAIPDQQPISFVWSPLADQTLLRFVKFHIIQKLCCFASYFCKYVFRADNWVRGLFLSFAYEEKYFVFFSSKAKHKSWRILWMHLSSHQLSDMA